MSLLPWATEIVYAFGLGDQLERRTSDCDYPCPGSSATPASSGPARAAATNLAVTTSGRSAARTGCGAVRDQCPAVSRGGAEHIAERSLRLHLKARAQ
jgi:hypothetical protein